MKGSDESQSLKGDKKMRKARRGESQSTGSHFASQDEMLKAESRSRRKGASVCVTCCLSYPKKSSSVVLLQIKIVASIILHHNFRLKLAILG